MSECRGGLGEENEGEGGALAGAKGAAAESI